MRIYVAGQRLAKGAADIASVLGSVINRARIAKLDHDDAKALHRARVQGPSVEQRREDLIRFYESYEDLVEVVCDVSQYGPTPRLEMRYLEYREHYLARYPNVRAFLMSYVRDEAEFLEPNPHTDPFAALALPPNLHELLRLDDGSLISRITRTREALNLYAEHLRQLTARKA